MLAFTINYSIVVPRVIYDRVRKKKNNFEITAYLNYERGTSRAANSKSNEIKNAFVFIWCFEFSRSWFSSFNLQKGGNFQIIFPVPYPIIYNPGYYYFLPLATFMARRASMSTNRTPWPGRHPWGSPIIWWITSRNL